MPKKSAVEPPPRLPIEIESVSNGEYVPLPLSRSLVRARERALERVAANARRAGVPRRAFLKSACAAATVLLVLDELGCGGRYRVPPEATVDEEVARAVLGGDELIFDVQTHHVSADRPWYRTNEPSVAGFLRRLPAADCGESHWVRCFARDPFLKEVFLDSDTRLAVLSALFGSHDVNPLHVEEAALTRERVAAMAGAPRLRIHGIMLPQLHGPGERGERMQDLHETWDVAAWKLYPVWGPDGRGYSLTDPVALDVFERGLRLGVPLFAIHKGLPLAGMDPDFT